MKDHTKASSYQGKRGEALVLKIDVCRYVQKLELYHDEDHLDKFEKLIETAIDSSKLPDEYFISPAYDPQLQVNTQCS